VVALEAESRKHLPGENHNHVDKNPQFSVHGWCMLVPFENLQCQVGKPCLLTGQTVACCLQAEGIWPKSLSTVTARKFEMLRYFDLCVL